MNKVSIIDYKHPGMVDPMRHYTSAGFLCRDDLINIIWDKVSWFEPQVKHLFGKELKLGLKYHINKLHKEYERNVFYFEDQLTYDKVSKNKRFIDFYDDLKLLETIYEYDQDWCSNRMMDEDPPAEPMQTGLNQSIYRELEHRISQLKFWRAFQ